MSIRKIRAFNFKSFKELDIELGDFNLLIGANASGKSNFIQLFQFIRDITNHGLDNAVSLQGGVEYLRNINIGSSDELSILFVLKGCYGMAEPTRKGMVGIRMDETLYEFALKFDGNGTEFKIAKDRLTQKYTFVDLKKAQEEFQGNDELGKGKLTVSNLDGKIGFRFYKNPKGLPIKREDMLPAFVHEQRGRPKTLLIENPAFSIIADRNSFNDFSIFDFDPRLPKKATPITGKAELEADGANLSIALKHIMEDNKKKKLLLNLVKDLLPFIDTLDVEKFADKSLMFKLQEKYFSNQYLPASLISDGTINMTALIVALYFGRKTSVIIEEPERNIHPHLISRVVEMIKDASRNKQIIATTHNPEMVKYSGLENMLFVSRDKDGFSTISRPVDNRRLKAFLENEIGIEELYIQDLIGV